MPDQSRTDWRLVAKLLTGCAIGMGLGFGLCGLGTLTPMNGPPWNVMTTLGILVFCVSFVVGLITALIAAGIQIVKMFRR